MRGFQLLITLIVVDLFLYYGAVGIGEVPYGGAEGANRFFSQFVNITDESANATAVSGLVETSLGSDTLIAGLEGTLLGTLSQVVNFLFWMGSVAAMPFILGDMMHLTGAAAVIPSVIYSAALIFFLIQFISGRSSS